MPDPAVCAALAEALAQDPFYQAVTAGATTRQERLRLLEHYAGLAIEVSVGAAHENGDTRGHHGNTPP